MLTDQEIVDFYLGSGKTKTECVSLLGCTQWRFNKALKNLNCTAVNYYKLPNCSQVKQMYDSGMRVCEIAKHFNVNHSSVSESLVKSGYTFVSKDERTVRTPLNESHKQIIEGELLGDGCIARQKGRINPIFRYGTITREYIEYLKQSLPFLSDVPITVKKAKSKTDKEGIEWNSKESYFLSSRSDKALRPFYESWYINDKKDVPPDFKLTRLSCLHWYLGDGSYSNGVITLCCDSFSEFGVKHLSKELEENGISNVVFSTGRESLKGASLRLRVNRTQARNFFDFIGVCPVGALRYKWR